MNSNIKNMLLEAKEKRIKHYKSYGLSTRAATVIANADWNEEYSKDDITDFLRNNQEHIHKYKGAGPRTIRELYQWAGLETPIKYKFKCPKCGHCYNKEKRNQYT
jgi:hypothetical protein